MQKAFIDQQIQKSDDKPFWRGSFSSYNLLQLSRKNEDRSTFKKVLMAIADCSFLELRNKMVMYNVTSKLNSAIGTIGKATGVKMTAEAVGKNSSSHFSVKNFNFAHVVMQ